jgi:hypothetical protein
MKTRILFAAAALAVAGSAQAHHSASMFDNSKLIEVAGTVKAWEFVNPHSWLQVVVMGADGKLSQWGFEGGRPGSGGDSPNSALRKDTFKPGDKVVVRTHPMRDGRPAGSLEEVVFADGHKWTMPSFAAAQALAAQAKP